MGNTSILQQFSTRDPQKNCQRGKVDELGIIPVFDPKNG
jgi:hypothetical protein